jgi:peptide-methionine (S)-S-oxide reductase
MKRIVTALLICLMTTAAAPAAQRSTQHVVLAGGCFWGMQAVFESLRGVRSTVAGYAGGSPATAHYDIVSTGDTGHAESVDVTYDPSEISFRQLLDVFFLVAHDPTQLDRQGPDEGTQYRSEIFYTTDAQRSEARAYIAQLERRHVFSAPVVTQVARLRGFFPAESYHQNFAVNNPDNPYIDINDVPKLRKLVSAYPSLVNPAAPTRNLVRL